MQTTKHTVSSFDADLDALRDHILRMGEQVDHAFTEALRVVASGDATLADAVISRDDAVDALERRVEEESVQTIARRQPLAGDLRDIMAAVRIASELERIGDLSKNIAKRAKALGDVRPPEDLMVALGQMGAIALSRLREVLAAYRSRDAAKADAVRQGDGEIDLLNTAFFRNAIDRIAATYRDVAGITHLLFCAKNIERIGDHVTNIAENVSFVVTGTLPQEERTKLDMSSTIGASGDRIFEA